MSASERRGLLTDDYEIVLHVIAIIYLFGVEKRFMVLVINHF